MFIPHHINIAESLISISTSSLVFLYFPPVFREWRLLIPNNFLFNWLGRYCSNKKNNNIFLKIKNGFKKIIKYGIKKNKILIIVSQLTILVV